MRKRMTPDNKDIVNRYVLVLDTETTGLPRGRRVTPDTFTKWDTARLVQIAWEFYNPAKECIKQESYIVTPDGFDIPEFVTKIHGISTERAHNEGIPLIDVLKKLHILLSYNPVIVAHNMQFDSDIILAEMYRYDNKLTNSIITREMATYKIQIEDMIELWDKCDKQCTMLMGTIPGEKWPKLAVLYEDCFGKAPEGEMHRADNDVRACADIYFHLLVEQMNGTNPDN